MLFAGVPLALAAAFFTWRFWEEAEELRAACETQALVALWPEANGRIIDTQVERKSRGRSTAYRPVIRYVYETPSGPQGGSLVRYDENPWCEFESLAESVAAGYPAGMPVTVKYHPDYPYISVLDGSAPRWADLRIAECLRWGSIALWAIAAAYTAMKTWVSIRRKRAER